MHFTTKCASKAHISCESDEQKLSQRDCHTTASNSVLTSFHVKVWTFKNLSPLTNFKFVVHVKLCSQRLPRSNTSQYVISPSAQHKTKGNMSPQSRNTVWKKKANIECLSSLSFMVGGKFWPSKHTLNNKQPWENREGTPTFQPTVSMGSH